MKKFITAVICIALIIQTACIFRECYCDYIYTSGCMDVKADNDEQSWNLILINARNKMDKKYIPPLTSTENGEKIAKKVYPHLNEMFSDAKKNGHLPVLTSGFRSEAEQKKLFNNRKNEYILSGHSVIQATELTIKYAAKPGHSEHETGLAADINSANGDSERLYGWLGENAYKYGFILRYP